MSDSKIGLALRITIVALAVNAGIAVLRVADPAMSYAARG